MQIIACIFLRKTKVLYRYYQLIYVFSMLYKLQEVGTRIAII